MKLKKLLTGIIAGVMAVATFATSVSAGEIKYVPTAAATNYYVKVTGYIRFAKVTFTQNDYIFVPSTYINGSTTATLVDKNNTTKAVTLDDVRINGAKITSSNVYFGFQNKENTLCAGETSLFTYTAKAYVTENKGTNPVDAFSIDLASAKLKDLNVTAGSYGALSADDTWGAATVGTDANADAAIPSDTYLGRTYINGGKGIKLTDRQAMAAATGNYTVVATLSKAITDTFAVFQLATDLSEESRLTASSIVYKGASAVTFTVPATYFVIPAGEYEQQTYSSLIIADTSGAKRTFSSIVITYNDAAATTTTTTAKVTTAPADSSDGEDAEAEEFIISNKTMTLNVGASYKLTTNYDDVKWKTTDKSVVKVYTSGKIKAMKAGTATITAINGDGSKITCKVTVSDSSEPATGIQFINSKTGNKITKASVKMSKSGVTTKLATAFTPDDSTDTINWSSSDETIATVSKTGKITLKSLGVVTITATTSSGKSVSIPLTVKSAS